MFDDEEWFLYNTINSGLPDRFIKSLAIDSNDTKWIGTSLCGLALFNENGIPVSNKYHFQPNHHFHLSIYPNPAGNTLTIDCSGIGLSPSYNCEIINIQGVIQQGLKFSGMQFILDISKLKTGMYILKITTENGQMVTGKFIKS